MHTVNSQIILPLEDVAVHLHPQDHVAIAKTDLEVEYLLTQTTDKPTPCIKIVSNSATFERWSNDMDVSAGKVWDGVALETVVTELLDLVIGVASGRPSRSEAQGVGEQEFSPWRPGETV